MDGRAVSDLLDSARGALSGNRRHGLTVPHARQFPGGYLWDLAVITKGVSVFDPQRAAAEIIRYLESQWGGGMLPNEIYFGDRGFQRRLFGAHPDRPPGLVTSGITQPPMIVRAALEVGRALPPDQRDGFLSAVFPSLHRLVAWILRERTGRNGLAVLIHPYESGMDNRIDLAEAMAEEWAAVAGGSLAGAVLRRGALTTLAATRRALGDTRHVPAAHRSSHADVLYAYLQLRHIRGLGYRFDAIDASGRGLLVEDPGYNAVLVDAFRSLRDIAAHLPAESAPVPLIDPSMTAAMDHLERSLEDLWHDDPAGHGSGYYSRDYRTGRRLLRPTVAGLFPLIATRDRRRADVLTRLLVDPAKYWTAVAPPSAPADSAGFTPDRYWRGPAWSFPADVIETGLRVQGRDDVATELREKYLRRPHALRHAEYENPLTGAPLGVEPFSPAAALSIRFASAPSVAF